MCAAAGRPEASVRRGRRQLAHRYAGHRHGEAGEPISLQQPVRRLIARRRRMMLPATLRFPLRLLRAGLHAAVVFTASMALLLLFLLWSVLQLVDENETAAR